MNWIFGLLMHYLRYFFGWDRQSGGTYPVDEFAREAERIWNEADRDSRPNSRVAPEVDFVSTAVPAEGTVDYSEMKWELFSQVIETPEQFTFYCGRSIAKVIARRQFSNHQEILALRHVIRRNVADSELLDD